MNEPKLPPMVGTLSTLPEHIQKVVESYARAAIAINRKTPATAAERLRDQDIEEWISTIATINCWGTNMSREQAHRFARAVEQATAARLGVKMGDARHADQA